jgi:hypothetical protein
MVKLSKQYRLKLSSNQNLKNTSISQTSITFNHFKSPQSKSRMKK